MTLFTVRKSLVSLQVLTVGEFSRIGRYHLCLNRIECEIRDINKNVQLIRFLYFPLGFVYNIVGYTLSNGSTRMPTAVFLQCVIKP